MYGVNAVPAVRGGGALTLTNPIFFPCFYPPHTQTKEYPEYAQFLVPQVEFIINAFVGQVNNVRALVPVVAVLCVYRAGMDGLA